MNVNPVAANAAAVALHAATSQGKDGDGDHGVEPAATPAARPSLPSGSTYSVYA